MGEVRVHAGYEIIESIKFNEIEFVLGKRIKGHQQFVNWICHNGTEYNLGIYTTRKNEARKTLYNRARNELSYRLKILKENEKWKTNK